MMKRVLLSLSVVLAAFACSLGPSLDRPAHEVSGPGFRIIHLGENRSSEFTIDLSITEPSDVFVIFTNPTGRSQTLPELRVSPETAVQSLRLNAMNSEENTRVADSQSGTGPLSATTGDASGPDTRAPVHRGNARLGVPGLREVEPDWYADAAEADATSEPEDVLRSSGLEASGYEAGVTEESLWRLSRVPSGTLSSEDFDKFTAHVRFVSDVVSGFQLVIWVENDLWGENGGSGDIQQDMVDTLGDALTKTVSGTSVFQTLTNTFGQPWGTTATSGLLRQDTDTVHVFLADIAGAGGDFLTPDGGSTAAFIAGYFFARDVFLNRSTTSSLPGNEKLMVYVHGPAFATGNSPWRLTDFWPSEMALTTAHEIQHLINYYQSSVRTGRQARTEVWLDELMSVLTEELVAERFQRYAENENIANWEDSFLGPRGVAPRARRPEATVSDGRLTDFVVFPDRSLTSWGGDIQYDYAASYAFGTWLVRNFGGVGLLPRIYESTSGGYAAIEDAVRWHTGESLTFGELLERWAAANVLSDRNIPARSYRLFGNDWFRSQPTLIHGTSAAEIRLGDIPFGTYQRNIGSGDSSGIFMFTPSDQAADDPFLQATNHASHANIYYQAAAEHQGPLTLDMSAPRAGRTTIIILEHQ